MSETTPAEDAPLYVLGVKAEKYMFIDVLDVALSTNGVTQFTGMNGNGKTDALSAIESTLFGGSSIPTMPVQSGAERAETEIPIGGPDGKTAFLAKRVYRDGGGTTLEVRSVDGAKQGSPQKLLDSLLDAKFFNPVKFASPGMRTVAADNAYRLEILFELCPLRIDLPKHDAETLKLFNERTEVRKRAKSLEAVVADAAKTTIVDSTEEDESVYVTGIAKAENAAELRSRAQKRVDELAKEIDDVEAEIERLHEKSLRLSEEWAKQGNLASAKDAPDLEPLKKKLAEVRERNLARRAGIADRAKAEERAKSLLVEKKRDADLTTKLETMEKDRDAAIAAAAFPLPQLTISSDGWLSVKKKDGGAVIPFHQESTAKRTVAAFVIFAASKQRLRACIVPAGNDLDHESMMRLAALSKKFKIPVFIERIVGDPEAGAVIEFRNGRVVK